VVEDDETLRLALEAGLDSEGFAVVSAGDTAGALELAAAEEPDLVLLDWILPDGQGGPATCRRIREVAPNTRVVMFTGLTDVRDQRAALEAGAIAFLRKGMPLEQIVSSLRRAAPTGRFERADSPAS
jgi:DNA-binding response OmpR family regulator